MWVYIFVLVLFMFLGNTMQPNTIEKKSKNYLIIIFGILILVSMLRDYSVGRDLYTHYYKNFAVLRNLDWSKCASTSYEVGYVIFNKVVGLFTDDGQWMIAMHALFVVGISGWFIYKNSDDVVISTFLFIIVLLLLQFS